MNAERIAVAQACLNAAYDGDLSFPEIVGKLLDAEFEGYAIDYRTHRQTYYMPDGDHVAFDMPHADTPVAAAFDDGKVQALIRWAQADAPDYSYRAFCDAAKAARPRRQGARVIWCRSRVDG